MSDIRVDIRGGTHIEAAAVFMVGEANLAGCATTATFNGIELRAEPGSRPDRVVEAFETAMAESARRYAESPEGIEAARKSAEEVAGLQLLADKLAAAVDGLDFTDQAAVVQFLADLQPASDRIGVKVDADRILIAFAEHDLVPNACVGDPDVLEDRSIFYRWLVGQALDGLARGLSIHGIFHKFAQRWLARWGSSPQTETGR